MEKHILCLIITYQKLKPYFQAHPIDVLTNVPIGQVLHRLGMSRRASKWALELNEYQIDFSPSKNVQGQALANFFYVPFQKVLWITSQ